MENDNTHVQVVDTEPQRSEEEPTKGNGDPCVARESLERGIADEEIVELPPIRHNEAEIIYLGRRDGSEDGITFVGVKKPDVVYWRTHLPSKEMTVKGSDIHYMIYHSTYVRPAPDVGEVGDLYILKNPLTVYWKKMKTSGNVAWKEARANEIVLHPMDVNLTLQAGKLSPRWHWEKDHAKDSDHDFPRAARAFLKKYEIGNTFDNPITLDF
ncbi:hypothetical protein CVT26_006291 [Gymnopilus dilepis]|uniref:Uncharacterized protein n=1 Tax=Gymnopilus dilepis TaxID=231916 RepID=A0A409Y0Q3_9AGAR|nr:hypothetical protein CVT26_006291 [Gymnopilus dilepis]